MMIPKDQQSREEIMDLLREAMYEFGDIDKLSITTGISKACLYHIRSGTTKWPRWNTFESLLEPLGLRMKLYRYSQGK